MPGPYGGYGDDHRDVARALADPECPTLSARLESLEGGALVHECRRHDQSAGIEIQVVLRVRRCGRDHLGDRFAGGLRCELQDVERILDGTPTNQVHDATCLHGRDADVLSDCPGRRVGGFGVAHRLFAFRSSLM